MSSKLFLASLLTCAALTGCLEGNKTSAGNGGGGKLNKPNVDEAERLAQEGEVLVNPITFMYADRLFEQALAADPENVKAGFYHALLKPAMRTRGLLTRIRPYVDSLGSAALEGLDDRIATIKQKDVKAFLLDGSPDLNSEVRIQAFVSDLIGDFSALRQFAKDHKTASLDITNRYYDRMSQPECTVVKADDGSIRLRDCGPMHVKTIRLTQPDFESLQQAAAGAQIAAIMATAYDLTGTRDVAQFKDGRYVPGSEVVDFIRGLPQMGRLKQGQRLSDVLAMGSDMVSAITWARSMQNQLCPGGQPAERGSLLVGPCIENSTTESGATVDELIHLAGLAMQGTSVNLPVVLRDGTRTTATVQPANFLRRPPSNIKTLLPVAYDHCGEPTQFGDDTLGGLFPAGGASRVILTKSWWACPYRR